MSGNITRSEAQARSALLNVSQYEIELDLTAGAETFRSTTRLTFASNQPGTPTWVDLIAPQVHAITHNGKALEPDKGFDGERIALSTTDQDNIVEVVAECAYMNTGEGLHRFVDPVDDEVYLYTQFETADARRMYACFDRDRHLLGEKNLYEMRYEDLVRDPVGEVGALYERLGMGDFAAVEPKET